MRKVGILAVAAASLIIGCGGAGDTSNLPSLYVGDWTGTWTSVDANDTGAIALTVTSNGSFSGTIATKTDSGTISGVIDKHGSMNAIGTFTNSPNMVITGAVTLNNGDITSNFTYTVNGVKYGGSFDCTPNTGGTTGG
ncbi:MAG: hypothetical protein GC165_19705 [Armatimonadetes bacterium]|nr:hypothetical protein [Armatimonadota bacterium]